MPRPAISHQYCETAPLRTYSTSVLHRPFVEPGPPIPFMKSSSFEGQGGGFDPQQSSFNEGPPPARETNQHIAPQAASSGRVDTPHGLRFPIAVDGLYGEPSARSLLP